MRGLGLVLLSVCVVSAASCSDRSESNPAPAAKTTTSAPPADATPTPAPSSTTVDASVADILAKGKHAYTVGQCVMCHGADGKGTRLGPDLTRGAWDHCDGSVDGILAVLDAGVSGSDIKNSAYHMAMPSAKVAVPDADTRRALAEYVRSLTNPASN